MIRSAISELANVLSILPTMLHIQTLPITVSILLCFIIAFHINRYIPNMQQSINMIGTYSHLIIPQMFDFVLIYNQTVESSILSGIFSFYSMKTFHSNKTLVNPKIDVPIVLILLFFMGLNNRTLTLFATRDLTYHIMEIIDFSFQRIT